MHYVQMIADQRNIRILNEHAANLEEVRGCPPDGGDIPASSLPDAGTFCPILIMDCLKSSRSSARSMDGSFAPISSMPYLSRMPLYADVSRRENIGTVRAENGQVSCIFFLRNFRHCVHVALVKTSNEGRNTIGRTSERALAKFRPVWPPMVGRMASGRS